MDIGIVDLIEVVTIEIIEIETVDVVIATIDVIEMIVVVVAATEAEKDHHDEIDTEMIDIVDVMTDLIETDTEMIETETVDDMMIDATIVAGIAVTETTDTSKNHVTKIRKKHTNSLSHQPLPHFRQRKTYFPTFKIFNCKSRKTFIDCMGPCFRDALSVPLLNKRNAINVL